MINSGDLKRELKHKKRSVVDLVRFIKTRNENNPNYSLFIGAGASVSSGVRTASELIALWRKQIYLSLSGVAEQDYDADKAKDWLAANETSWYNPAKEYSSLFEKNYDLPRQRRMFVEQEVANSFPSLGYAYLIKLTESNYFNTLFTTNFDDLINEAFYQFSEVRPIVCAHDSSVNSITITSKRPKILKLHGDYLFDDIKSTLRETESLEENIRNKFIEFTKEFGLMVIGYGGNDRSVMDVLFFLLKSELYLKGGIYWCIRKGDEVGDELRKLLWKDKVYFVEIDGFDEIMAILYNEIIGDSLPVDNNLFSQKMIRVMDRYISSNFLKGSKCLIIQEHLNRLNEDRNSSLIADTLRSLSNVFSEDKDGPEITDEQYLILLNIEKLFKNGLFDDVIEKTNDLIKNLKNKDFDKIILKKRAKTFKLKKEFSNSRKTYDKLIELEPENPDYNIEKAKLHDDLNSKITELDKAIEKDPYFYYAYCLKASALLEKYKHLHGEGKKELVGEIYIYLETAIERLPSIKNPAWQTLFLFMLETEEPSRHYKDPIEIISAMERQDKYSYITSRMILEYCEHHKIFEYNGEELTYIVNLAKKKQVNLRQVQHDIVLTKTFRYMKNVQKLKELFQKTDKNPKYLKNAEFIEEKASACCDLFYDLNKAIKTIKRFGDLSEHSNLVFMLICLYIGNEQIDNAKTTFSRYNRSLDKYKRIKAKVDIYEAQNDFQSAIDYVMPFKDDPVFEHYFISTLSYYYLKSKQYEKAKQVTGDFLKEVNFSIDHSVELINYELASLRCGKKVKKDRIDLILKRAEKKDDTEIKVACLLLEKNKYALSEIEDYSKNHFSFLLKIISWPIADPIRKKLIEMKNNMQSNI